MTELTKYRNELSAKGYTTIFNMSKCLLSIFNEHGELITTKKLEYSCGSWYARVD